MAADAMGAPAAPAAVDADAMGPAFEERRLEELVRYSRSLRVQMWIIAISIAGVIGAGGAGWTPALLWLAGFLLVREARAAALVRMVDDEAMPIAHRLRRTMWWSLALGAAHGAAALFIMQLDLAADALLSMVLMSLSAGAVSTTYTVLPAFNAYALAISLPTTVMWMWQGGQTGWGVALLVLLFTGVQIRFARQNMAMFDESYRIRLENTELLRQLEEERRRLAAARDAAVRADLAKSRFLASASHDLRQPLQSLEFGVGALRHLALPGDGAQIVSEIRAGVQALNQMLSALLDVSMLDAGAVPLNLQPLPLDRLLDDLSRSFRASAASKGLRLSVDCPPLSVFSDVNLLRRVLSNLIDNAVKFTERGDVAVTARAEGGRIVVDIRDTGIGIAAGDQERIFEDLVQLGNAERARARGHGLGLAIVRRQCRLLGAEISLCSVAGEGSCFSVSLPLAGDLSPVFDDASHNAPALIGRRVLVLDDDPAVRTAYARALVGLGCEVRCVATLAAALQALQTLRPEIALVDYRLAAHLDGLQAIARLRADAPGLPAVVVSADTGLELHREAAPQGVPVLRKPVSEAALAMAINEAIHGGRRETPGE